MEEPTAASTLSGESAPVETSAEPITSNDAGDAPVGKFYDGVSDEHKGFFENKNYENLDAMAKSYKSLEAMRGVPENELLRIPKPEDTEGLGKMYDRLGRPESGADYKFDGLEVGSDADWFRESAHKAGMSDSQVTQVFKDFSEAISAMEASADEKFVQESQLAMNELKTEWGAAYEANAELATNAAKTFGVSQEELSGLEKALGTKGLMNFMHRIGKGTSEGSLVDAKTNPVDGSSVMTPQAAKDASAALMKDPQFKERYFSKDPEIRKAAMRERHVLNQLAAGKGE